MSVKEYENKQMELLSTERLRRNRLEIVIYNDNNNNANLRMEKRVVFEEYIALWVFPSFVLRLVFSFL